MSILLCIQAFRRLFDIRNVNETIFQILTQDYWLAIGNRVNMFICTLIVSEDLGVDSLPSLVLKMITSIPLTVQYILSTDGKER